MRYGWVSKLESPKVGNPKPTLQIDCEPKRKLDC